MKSFVVLRDVSTELLIANYYHKFTEEYSQIDSPSISDLEIAVLFLRSDHDGSLWMHSDEEPGLEIKSLIKATEGNPYNKKNLLSDVELVVRDDSWSLLFNQNNMVKLRVQNDASGFIEQHEDNPYIRIIKFIENLSEEESDVFYDEMTKAMSKAYGLRPSLHNIGSNIQESPAECDVTGIQKSWLYKAGKENEYMCDGTSLQDSVISCSASCITCEDCDDTYYFNGNHFSSYESVIGYRSSVDSYLCNDCVDTNYSECRDCRDLIENEIGIDYCNSCNEEDVIRPYDYVPSPLNYWTLESNKLKRYSSFPMAHKKQLQLMYGWELEVEMKYSEDDRVEIAKEIIDSHPGMFWCKNDGSLDFGFEICSHPMTFDALKSLDLYDAIFRHRGNIVSYNTSTCGMHVHMSRAAFSENHLYKFITMIHEYKVFSIFIAQRSKIGEINEYSRFESGRLDSVKRDLVDSIQTKKNPSYRPNKKYAWARNSRKYVAVNLAHDDTIEVRIFKGNLKEVSFRKNIEFLDALYYFTLNTPLHQLRLQNFIEYITKRERKRYKNLVKYIETNSSRMEKILEFPLARPRGINTSAAV